MTTPTIINDAHELVPVGKLTTHPANPRQGDIGAVAASIDAHGFYGALVVQRSTGHVLAGNHRLLAARQLKMKRVPVVWVDVDDEQATRILLADNRTSDLGTYDNAALADLLKTLATTDRGLDGIGYDGDDLDALLLDLGSEGTRTAPDYTMKVEAPIYEPTGAKPDVSALAKTDTRDELLAAIDDADLPDDLRRFLRLAAERHTRFDYEVIANFYAHAPAEVQRLMEASALVVIDYEQAIERGYVRFHDAVNTVFGEDHPDA
jgi:hypothetical protein